MTDSDLQLSFPAILRNPQLLDRFAHLHLGSDDDQWVRRAAKDRTEPEGKRWVRRRENAKFTHNPHIALPTSLDFASPLQLPLSTFPRPLPPYLPRSIPVPPSRLPPSLPQTSSAGLFSLSLRGARRTLRARPSSAYLVKAIETHLTTWLQGGTYLNPDDAKDVLRFPGDPIGDRQDIREVAREAGKLVWAVKPDGGFERYVVHCVARWYGVVSFSKDTDGYRLTYLLRPNVTRPDPRLNAASPTLDTPPITDASDVPLSDLNTTDASDADSVSGDISARSLTDIEESRPASPASWSIIGQSDAVAHSDDDVDDLGFAASMESLSLSAHADSDDLADSTLTPSRPPSISSLAVQGGNSTLSRARANRDNSSALYPRSTSSPSPARRSPRRLPFSRNFSARRKRKAKKVNKGLAEVLGAHKGTFYNYLFSET